MLKLFFDIFRILALSEPFWRSNGFEAKKELQTHFSTVGAKGFQTVRFSCKTNRVQCINALLSRINMSYERNTHVMERPRPIRPRPCW